MQIKRYCLDFYIYLDIKEWFIGKTSGILRELLDRRTSWARSVSGPQPAVCGRTGSGCPWSPSSTPRQHLQQHSPLVSPHFVSTQPSLRPVTYSYNTNHVNLHVFYLNSDLKKKQKNYACHRRGCTQDSYIFFWPSLPTQTQNMQSTY